MTVPNVPFWLSDANSEFGGNGWASDICAKAGLALPADLIDLAGRSALTVIGTIPTVVNTTSGAPYLYFTFNGTNTIVSHNNGATNNAVAIVKGRPYIHIRNGGITYVGTSDGTWFQPDANSRGVRLDGVKGASRSVSITVSNTNASSGAIISTSTTLVMG